MKAHIPGAARLRDNVSEPRQDTEFGTFDVDFHKSLVATRIAVVAEKRFGRPARRVSTGCRDQSANPIIAESMLPNTSNSVPESRPITAPHFARG